MTTESHDNPGAAPVALGSTDGLGQLPAHPTARTGPGNSGWTSAEKRAIVDYAAQQVAAERERCALRVDLMRSGAGEDAFSAGREAGLKAAAAMLRAGPGNVA